MPSSPAALANIYILVSCALLQAEDQPGFSNALLDILQTEQDSAVQLCSMPIPPFLPVSFFLVEGDSSSSSSSSTFALPPLPVTNLLTFPALGTLQLSST